MAAEMWSLLMQYLIVYKSDEERKLGNVYEVIVKKKKKKQKCEDIPLFFSLFTKHIYRAFEKCDGKRAGESDGKMSTC